MAGAKAGGGFANKQHVLTPRNDMGDIDANYNAIHIADEDVGGGGRDAAAAAALDSRIVSTDGAKVDFDVETRHPESDAAIQDDVNSRERRLTLKQLERFRRAMAKRSRRGSRAGSRWGTGNNDAEFDDLFGDTGAGPCKELCYTTYPWPYWLFGGVVVIATTIFVDRVRANSLGAADKANQDWWKYVVAFLVYSIAIGLIANGRVETFCMSKEQNRLLIRSVKPLCFIGKLRRERCVDRALCHIVDIRVEGSGEFSGDIDTRSYKIHFEFDDGAHATALELRSKKRTLERCRIIKDFLFSCVAASAIATTPTSAGVAAVAPLASLSPVAAAGVVTPAPSSPRKEAALPSVPSSSLPRKTTNAAAPDAVS